MINYYLNISDYLDYALHRNDASINPPTHKHIKGHIN